MSTETNPVSVACACPSGMRYHAINCVEHPGALMNPVSVDLDGLRARILMAQRQAMPIYFDNDALALIAEVERLRAQVEAVRAMAVGQIEHAGLAVDSVLYPDDVLRALGDCPECAASAGRCVAHALD